MASNASLPFGNFSIYPLQLYYPVHCADCQDGAAPCQNREDQHGFDSVINCVNKLMDRRETCAAQKVTHNSSGLNNVVKSSNYGQRYDICINCIHTISTHTFLHESEACRRIRLSTFSWDHCHDTLVSLRKAKKPASH